MPNVRTRRLLAAATFASGILAGTVVDRALVGGPAWHALGAQAWAQFSRHADLGTGLIVYPVEAVGTTLLLIAALVSNRFDRNGGAGTSGLLVAAAALSIFGLLITAKAAPIMLSLRAVQPPAELLGSFGDFFLWGIYLRGIVDIFTFVATVWALSATWDSDRSKTLER
jgi:hypothetical protein